MIVDLHTHSEVSDGTDTPAEVVSRAARLGVAVLALTDHDTFDGLDEAAAAASRLGVRLVRGTEMSTSFAGQSVHLLAYGCDETHPELGAELERIRRGRGDRLAPLLARLAELGFPLQRSAVLAEVGDSPSAGRPHVADALVRAGFVRDRDEAFSRLLRDGGPAHVPRYSPDVADAIDLVHAAGGVAVIAHPWGRREGRAPVVDELERLVAEHGLDGWEVQHADHDAEARAALGRLGARLGVLTTGSSDYHGTGKVGHEIGSERTDPEVWARLAARLDA